jgi:DNA invertase Pin-like site-specific DNA recombinase
MEKLANVAELEAGMISDQTKKALATAKARGVASGPATRATKAAAHAASLGPTLARLEAGGRRSLNAIARALTAEGIPTAAGAANWTPTGVARVKAKLAV